MSVPDYLRRLYPTPEDLAERLDQADLEAMLRRSRVPRGAFQCRLVTGQTVTVGPQARRPDLGPHLYEVAEGDGAQRRIVAYVRGPLPAADVTRQVQQRLAERLKALQKPPPAAVPEAVTVPTIQIETVQAGVKQELRQRPLDRYFRQAKAGLTGRQWAAGDRLQRQWETGPMGARDAAATGTAVAGREPGMAQLVATRAFSAALAALGARLGAIVRWVVLEEKTVESWAARQAMDRKHAMGVLRVALDILADHYGEPGGDPDQRRRMRATVAVREPA